MDVSVAITSFRRARFLGRAIDSAVAAGFKNIVVSAMEPTDEVEAALAESVLVHGTEADFTVHRSVEQGCNELWLRAAYYAKTKHVIILHDDDVLLSDLGGVYESVIAPELNDGVGFASWRGHVVQEGGRVIPVEYMPGKSTGIHPSADLERFLLKRGKLSLSPIISVFNREVLIHALKEADQVLNAPCSYLHPGMLLGTEIMAYLRHCSSFPRWLYISRVLSHYGSWEGSGTVRAERSGNLRPLVAGYDVARSYYEKHKDSPASPKSKVLLMSSPFDSNNIQEQKRFENARKSWDYHFDLGDVLDFPVHSCDLPRCSSAIGDNRKMPYLRDLFDYGCQHAMPEDVVAYSNLDIHFTVNLFQGVRAALARSDGICVGWRRTMPYDASRLYLSAKNGKMDGGVDFVAMTPAWWAAHRDKIPDLFIGASHWDYVLRTYAERLTQGKCYIHDGTIHAPHSGVHSQLKQNISQPAQRHNHDVAINFFKAIGDRKAVQHLERTVR